MDKNNLYPTIKISKVEHPNKLYAVPIIGFLAKIVLLIPVAIELIFLGLGLLVIMLIGSFYTSFTGKYWPFAYRFNLGLIRLLTKVSFYFYGLTDKYPYFDFTIKDRFQLDIPYPQHPNMLFAFPFIGGLIRAFLLIPYFIFEQIISRGAAIAYFVSFYNVLSKGSYPESTFEFERDTVRVNQASAAYMLGLSDEYPSFYMSMNNLNIKIALLIAGAALTLGSTFSQQYPAANKYDPTTGPQVQQIPTV